MAKFNPEVFQPFYPQEAALMKSVESGEWKSVENVEQAKEKALKKPPMPR